MKGDPPTRFLERRPEAIEFRGYHFSDVARHGAYSRGFFLVTWIALEQVPVFLHRDAAAARRHDDRLHSRLDVRPPAVDQCAHVFKAVLLIVQMKAQRAAAAGALGLDERNADAVEHPCRGGVDVGRERRLYAAGEREHLPGVARRGPGAGGGRRCRHLFGELRRKKRPQKPAELEEQRKQPAARHDFGEGAALEVFPRGPRRFFFDQFSPDIEQAPVLNARRAGRLAGAAGQTAVEVQARLVGDPLPFERLLHEVDAPARPVVLVAEQQIGRAGRGAEAAVHALAQDRVGLAPLGRVADEIGERGLHQRSGYIRPRLKMPCGSNSRFNSRWIFMSAGASSWKTPTDLSPPRNSVAWPPARFAASRTVRASAREKSQRSAAPHSIICSP